MVFSLQSLTENSKDDISSANKKYHEHLRKIYTDNYDTIYDSLKDYMASKDPIYEDMQNTFVEKETLLGVVEASNGHQTQKIDETVIFSQQFPPKENPGNKK